MTQPDGAHGISQRHEVILRRRGRRSRPVEWQLDDLPPARRAGALRVARAQVIGAGFGGEGEGAKDRG